MGQYQQWLLYRELDQRLRAQLEALETELAQVQDRARLPEQTCSQPGLPGLPGLPCLPGLPDNQILRALAISIEREAAPITPSSPGTAGDESAHALSPSLQHWGELPDFSPEAFHNGEQSSPPSTPTPAATSHAEMVLLPEEALAAFDKYSQTDPQLELPWWLHNIMVTSNTFDPANPVDQETIRTNRLVQRWLERWGRRPPTDIQQTMPEDDPHE